MSDRINTSTHPGSVPYIAVVGPAAATAEQRSQAGRVGNLLAQRSCVVLTGGHGGVMAAAAEAASAGGAVVVALLPGLDRSEASSGHGVAITTGLGELRNALLVRSADAVVAVGASWGTLSEVALAVRTGVPVATIGGWDPSEAMGVEASPLLTVCNNAEEAVAVAVAVFTR